MGLNHDDLQRAAEAVASADALVIGAGSGMGVDSGLPDFRGDKGFWKAYPPYAKLGLGFIDMANPEWFASDPNFAWGFYGHRLNLYRTTVPHGGFDILKRWGESMRYGYFVFTSNVDGQFQKAGYDPERILECHGTIHWGQCTDGCGEGLFHMFPGKDTPVQVDHSTMQAVAPLPACPGCGALARPNVLMFGDWGFDGSRTGEQWRRLENWQAISEGCRVVAVECGAGGAIPTVRHFCQSATRGGGTLIRINPREPEVPTGQIGFDSAAMETLSAIDALLGKSG